MRRKEPWNKLAASQSNAVSRLPKYHGGPILKTGKSKSEKGLRPQQRHSHGQVIEIMKDGQILHPTRLAHALPQIQAALKIAAERQSQSQFPPQAPVAGCAVQGGTVA